MAARHRKRRRSAPRRRVRRWLRRQDRLTRALLGAVALLSLLVVALFSLLLQEDRTGQRAERAPRKATSRQTAAPARPAVPPVSAPSGRASRATRETRPLKPPAPRPAPAPSALSEFVEPRPPLPAVARAAIVIDDLGQSFSHFEQLAALELPLSVAVIPGLPAAARTVREASRRGVELLLHQPMEPHESTGKNPGDGVLLTSMSGEDIRARLRAGLVAVPGAVGVNNHMGSRFTEDPAGIGAVMAELRERDLFWLDSRTSPATHGLAAARAAGVPAIGRDIFIDAEVDAGFIRGQLRKLLETARARGAAVAIGHPHPETISALREMREELLASGVRLVPLSRLVRATPAKAPLAPAPAVIARQARRTAADRPPAASP